MRIDALFAILLVLFCPIVRAYADKPIMIKDLDAIQYVGKEVEVRGRVVSVTTSPLGTPLSISEETTPIKGSPDSLQQDLRSRPIGGLL
jgi:hypothetical protein